MVEPGKLAEAKNKETEAAAMIDNIETFGINRRKQIQLQNWAKGCR